MGIDYTALLAKVRKIIRENGRPATLVKKNNTPDDADMPWLGSTGDDTELVVTAVFGTYKSEEADGDAVRRGDKKVLIDADIGTDLRNYDQIKEGSDVWHIVDYDEVAPGAIDLLYILQVRQ